MKHGFVQQTANHQVVGCQPHLLVHSLRVRIVVVGGSYLQGSIPGQKAIVLQDGYGVGPRHHVGRTALHDKIVAVRAVEKRQGKTVLCVDLVFQFGIRIVYGGIGLLNTDGLGIEPTGEEVIFRRGRRITDGGIQ